MKEGVNEMNEGRAGKGGRGTNWMLALEPQDHTGNQGRLGANHGAPNPGTQDRPGARTVDPVLAPMTGCPRKAKEGKD